MCVIIVAWKVHPDYPLVLISNRDEYFARDTLAAAPWTDDPNVFGGRDGLRGGTWLGITEDGRLAAITNYRNGPLRDGMISPQSRGDLTANWLKHNMTANTAEEFLKSINCKDYDGYNLIVGTIQSGLWFTSNFVDNGAVKRVEPGIHGVANQFFNAPDWPKVDKAKQNLEMMLRENNLDQDKLTERLFQILENDKMYDELPDTGIGIELERLFSSMFVKADAYDYGTRASTVIIANKNGEIRFVERTFGREHKLEQQVEHCMKITK